MNIACRMVCGSLGAVLLLAFLSHQATPQDPVKVAPDVYRVLLNNDQVRVLEVRMKPGASSPMHSHPAHVIYGMSEGRVRFTTPNGEPFEAAIKPGETAWHEAELHSVENIGTTEARVLVVEMKSSPRHESLVRTTAPRDNSREYGDEDQAEANFEPLVTTGECEALWASLASLRWQKLMPELGVASPEGAMLCVNPDTKAAQIIYRQVKNAHHPRHSHSANATVVVLSGRMTVKTDKTVDLGPGDFLYVPRETILETWTPADQGCMLLVTTDGPCSATWIDGTPAATAVLGSESKRMESDHHVVLRSGDLQWNDAPKSLPPGAKLAVLAGDPNNPQPFTMRIRVPAGYRIPPHQHPGNENVTVISGSLIMGMGDDFNTEYGHALSAGDFVMMPAGTHHFAFAPEETTVEIHGIGPWGITYVNPDDDPRVNKVTQQN